MSFNGVKNDLLNSMLNIRNEFLLIKLVKDVDWVNYFRGILWFGLYR